MIADVRKEPLRSGLPNGCYVTLRATSSCRSQRHLVLTSRLLHLKRAFSEFMRRKALRVCLFIYFYYSLFIIKIRLHRPFCFIMSLKLKELLVPFTRLSLNFKLFLAKRLRCMVLKMIVEGAKRRSRTLTPGKTLGESGASSSVDNNSYSARRLSTKELGEGLYVTAKNSNFIGF